MRMLENGERPPPSADAEHLSLAVEKHLPTVAYLRSLNITSKKQPGAIALHFLMSAGLLFQAGCAISIQPPRDVRDPANVFLVDYQHHASLMLPNEDGGYSEFAYGEWHWFAENHETVLDALRIALLPGQGTLGRRPWGAIQDAETLKAGMGVEAVYLIRVESLRAAALLRRLNDDFARDPSGEIFNERESMAFVPHRDTYWLNWNCNSAVAAWLEFLECRIRGVRLFANFRVESQP